MILGGRGILPGQSLEEAAFHNQIYSIDINEISETFGNVDIFGTLPGDLASHQSALIEDQYILMYGGFNGLRFFDSVIRYTIASKKWELMTK